MELFSNSIELLDSVDTIINADCVEWCPINGYENFLLCGTYQLQEDSGLNHDGASSRVGGIGLYHLDANHLHFHSQLNGSGILDLKWSPVKVNDKIHVSSATSEGQLELFALATEEKAAFLKQSNILLEDDGLLLSIDWSCVDAESVDLWSSVSTSKGNLFVVQLMKEGLKVINQWKAHDFETWICSFDFQNKSLLYSGSDDCKLKGWDLRKENQKPIFTLTAHSMGVTSIQSNPHRENLFASGSYDEHLFLWDRRKLCEPLSSLHLGGGVWKLKWEPSGSQMLAAACMHNGVHIVNCSLDTSPVIADSFMSHKSLAYGISWNNKYISEDISSHGNHTPSIFTLASCSFYDHNLLIWRWKSSKNFKAPDN